MATALRPAPLTFGRPSKKPVRNWLGAGDLKLASDDQLLELIGLQDELDAADRQAVNSEVEPFIKYASDPVGFVRNGLGEHLWSRQREIAQALRDNRRVAVPSAHGVGKSFLAARLVSYWLSTTPIGDSFAVTSAPTFEQVRAILWREINRAHARGKLPGRVNQTEWLFGNELVGFGRKPNDMDMTGFQGIHARRVMVVFDEACGIPKDLWTAADSLITNEDSRFLAIGNPDDPASEFARICKPGSGWKVLPISVFDSPNFTDEEIPDYLRPLLTGATWVEEKRKDWGETSALWKAKVTGQFSEETEDSLFRASWVNEAIRRSLEPGEPNELGVDVSRGGDETVIYHRRGSRARLKDAFRVNDLMAVTGRVVQAQRETGAKRIRIDAAGMGWGPYDRLVEMQREGAQQGGDGCLRGVAIEAVNVGEAARDTERFRNLKAELHWGLRKRFQDGDIDIEADDTTSSQLLSLQFSNNSRGQIEIESKEDMAKRGLPSPDRAEALILAFAETGASMVMTSDHVAAFANAFAKKRR